ncbi:MAG TPA: DNA polymerase I [Chlamydiales bacterium]|nr:DNA polymerase I [Chlamydiales bacterium]
MEELYLLDAMNYLFRSYYAIGPMTNDKGESTNALYGFIRSILKVIKEFSPTHLACVFDGENNIQARQAIYEEYKSHRKKAPEDLYQQIDKALLFCELYGLPCLNIRGVEADDTIASVTTWAEKLKTKVFICSSDKDLFQLVSDNVFVLNVHKENLLIDAQKVEEIYGVPPRQMLDLLSIMGDTSDNIPGIPGLGPKTAAALLKEFDTLENLLANPDKVSGKKSELLKTYKDQAHLSKKLASLHMGVSFPKEEDFFKIKTPNYPKLEAFYHEMKFMTLLRELGPKEEKKEVVLQPEVKQEYVLIEELQDLKRLIAHLQKQKEICLDTETTDIHPLTAELVGIGLGYEPGKAAYLPLNGKLFPEIILHELKPLLENPAIGFYGHNFKYDYHVLQNYGIKVQNISFDTILASYLLTPQNRRHNLDELVLARFNKNKIPITNLIGTGKKTRSMKEVPIKEVAEYCCEDVDYTCRLKELFKKEIKEEKLEKVMYEVELPLLPILAKMERAGIYLDAQKLQEMSVALEKQIHALEQEIYKETGHTFNLNSPKQLSEVLYQRLGLQPPGKKKTEFSTDAKVLEMLAEENVVASKILEYRSLEKLRSTYVSSLPELVHKKTQRIHCTFNQSVAATGRLSCQDPNLQNIPVRTPEGRKIREGFKPEKEGWSYLSADYSQIELRLLAHLSEDKELIKAFERGDDIHAFTASLVFDVDISKITKEMRNQAKTVNFGILYGQSAFGLSQELKIPQKEAAEFIKTYFRRYPKILEYLESSKQKVREKGYAETLTGRKRPIPEIHSKNPHIRAAAERLATNTPLQGTAADIIKLAMIHLDAHLRENPKKGYLIVQVHDELLFELPDEEVPYFQRVVKEKMESAMKLRVPLIVDIEVGKNWGEC